MRRRQAARREPGKDWRYGREDVERFIHKVMLCGKKTVAQRIVYTAFDLAEAEAHRPALEIFQEAMRNATPFVRVKPRRVGGATYQVPVEVPPETRSGLAIRWLIQAARSRKGAPMAQRLATEFLEASRGQGAAAKRRDDIHRMAEANRAFAHYRW